MREIFKIVLGYDFDDKRTMKIIENNGGVFEEVVKLENYNKKVRGYRIKLKELYLISNKSYNV